MTNQKWREAGWADTGPPLTTEDWKTLKLVDFYHQAGRELYSWWREINRRNTYADRFRLLRLNDPHDTNFGFIDTASITGIPELPVLGTVQQMLYYRPKKTDTFDVEWIKAQVREFMLRYFMRVASFSDPQLVPSKPPTDPPFMLRHFRWGNARLRRDRSWGFRQKYFKLSENGRIGRFPSAHDTTVVDVREVGAPSKVGNVGRKYDWIVLNVNVSNFTVHLPPFASGLRLGLPSKAVADVILSPDFILDEDDPREINPNNPRPHDKVVGRYGWGYCFIKSPNPESFFAYAPEGLGPAFMSFHFDVHESGDVRLYNYFAANQPTSFMRIPASPFEWGFELADLMSFGLSSRLLKPLRQTLKRLPYGSSDIEPIMALIKLANFLSNDRAERELMISRREVLKTVMAIHFMDAYKFQLGTLPHWRRFPEWTDPTKLPQWVKTGEAEEHR